MSAPVRSKFHEQVQVDVTPSLQTMSKMSMTAWEEVRGGGNKRDSKEKGGEGW